MIAYCILRRLMRCSRKSALSHEHHPELSLEHLDVAHRASRIYQAVVEVGHGASGQVHQTAHILDCSDAKPVARVSL